MRQTFSPHPFALATLAQIRAVLRAAAARRLGVSLRGRWTDEELLRVCAIPGTLTPWQMARLAALLSDLRIL